MPFLDTLLDLVGGFAASPSGTGWPMVAVVRIGLSIVSEYIGEECTALRSRRQHNNSKMER